MANGTDDPIFDDDGWVRAASREELCEKLENYYGITGLSFREEQAVDMSELDELDIDIDIDVSPEPLPHPLIYTVGDQEYPLAIDIPVIESEITGGVAIDGDNLPSKEKVQEVVRLFTPTGNGVQIVEEVLSEIDGSDPKNES